MRTSNRVPTCGLTCACLAVLASAGAGVSAEPSAGPVAMLVAHRARWIWFPEGDPHVDVPAETRFFRREFTLAAGRKVKAARLYLTADDALVLFVNGRQALKKTSVWQRAGTVEIGKRLVPGRNVLAVAATNGKGPAGLIAALVVEFEKPKPVVVVTDGAWKASRERSDGWHLPSHDDSAWPAAKDLGPVGVAPWGPMGFGPAGRWRPEPTEPVTRTLTEAEAEEILRRDWLFQARGEPPAKRALAEIGWARELAGRLFGRDPPAGVQRDLDALERLEKRLRAAAPSAEEARRLYLAVRRVKRRIAFRNPVLDFTSVIFIDQPYPRGSEWRHQSIHRMGHKASAGGRLLILDGLSPGGKLRKLAPDRPGSFWRPEVSFDAARVLFCHKPQDERSFHLYEMNLAGGGPRQLTDSDYDDVDPIYLPDGHILFTTTRGNSYVRCGPFIYSYILARCDADGGNVYLISHNGEPDFVPSLMRDGRVIYSRWEYTDKALWRVQSLWTVNQDGTGTAAFWGNQSVWPDHLAEPRQIPGSRRVMFTAVGHHDWFSGSIGIIDPDRGLNFPHGLTKVTRDLRWPECSRPPVDPGERDDYHAAGRYTGYLAPYPLSQRDFLVSARGEGSKFRLYLMDTSGNRELIYEGAYNVWHGLPVRRRPRPQRQPDLVAWPGTGAHRKRPAPGVFYSSDVYAGVVGLPRGSARFLRVFQLDHKTYSTWRKTYRHSGPPVSIVQEEGVKRILSVVPVESDGSVYFQVPPGRSVYFQLLDERFRCLQTMRSFTGVMPGEKRGCVGCHEMHSTTPPRSAGLAFRRAPTEPSPPPWGTESISYERFAQPVLDRYCGRCHQGGGKARKKLDLTLRPGVSVFKEPYLTLVGRAGWGNPVRDRRQGGYGLAGAIPVETMDPTRNDPAAYATIPPRTCLSYTSRLIERAAGGRHHGVKVDPLSLRRLIAWVDACCPFMGEPEIRALPDPQFAGIEALPIRPRVRTAPVIERP